MHKLQTSAAPLIVVSVMLVLPMLYLGGYFALVVPGGMPVETIHLDDQGNIVSFGIGVQHYSRFNAVAQRFFCPLEQLDRQLRPAAWETP